MLESSKKIQNHLKFCEEFEFLDENWLKISGISVSTIATLTAIIAVPMLYNYMQHVQSSLQNEVQYFLKVHGVKKNYFQVEFCKHRTDGLWDEFHRVSIFNFP